jgi:hypothetical protein
MYINVYWNIKRKNTKKKDIINNQVFLEFVYQVLKRRKKP